MIVNVAFDTVSKEMVLSMNGMVIPNVDSASFYNYPGEDSSMRVSLLSKTEDMMIYTSVNASKIKDGVQE